MNDEPMPTAGAKSRPVQALALQRFIDTFKSQWDKGKQKYNSDLMTHNGRNAANDAMQEVADLVAYIQQLAMELEDARAGLVVPTKRQEFAEKVLQAIGVSDDLQNEVFAYELRSVVSLLKQWGSSDEYIIIKSFNKIAALLSTDDEMLGEEKE